MKKNTMMRVASALLVAVLLTTCAISGTFAKYVTTVSGNDIARVAVWDIDFAGNDSTTENFVFDLFNTVNDLNGDDTGNDLDVKDGENGAVIIAPGTTGSFDIVITNNSEVNAQVMINFTEELDGVPLTFTYKNGNADYTEGSYVAVDMGNSVTITVSWELAFGDNVIDNEHSGKTVSVTAEVTAEQVN